MILRWLRTAVVTLGLVASTFGSVHALEIPAQPDGYITDRAGILSANVRSQLTHALQEFEYQTSTQITVATFPSLEDESLEDFSIRLAERWKVGKKGRDNGVILLIFPEDRLMRIEVGYGLEGALPDALASQIIREAIVPRFREGDYEGGVIAGVQAIAQATQGEFAGDQMKSSERTLTPEEEAAMVATFTALLLPLLLILFVIAIIDFFRYVRYKTDHTRHPARYNFLEWWFRFAILFFVVNIIFRIAFYSMLFSRGGAYGSRGGFGGFSGGGGGFGGGGASGSW